MDVFALRHPKEKDYYVAALVLSIIIHVFTLGLLLVFACMSAIPLWISEKFFKAAVFGHAVRVSERQFPKIHEIVLKQMRELKMEKEMEVFIYNGQGIINAFALKFLSEKYVILMSNLVDLMLKREAYPELEMVIGHELAHHALKHTSAFKNMILMPSKFIPFVHQAYSRGCEYSADRVGFELTKGNKSAIRGLLSITLGSEALSNAMDIKSFVEQEKSVPPFFGFIANAFATHPRMTKRIQELLPTWERIAPEPVIIKQPIVYDEAKYMPKM
jgi:Zn-dependent protease with chaperone function